MSGMKRFFYGLLLFTGGLFFSGCGARNSVVLENGVSQSLAQHRKQMISDLKYQLMFDIPKEQAMAIPAKVRIGFVLKAKEDVVLDFREDAGKIQEVVVNGSPCEYVFEKEHLIIPAKALKAGNNEIGISFSAGESSLNRNADYLYTLLVPDRARTLFPCFDQPDLKARFTLALNLPEGWKAVSNSPVDKAMTEDDRQVILYKETEPLSTYLFSFVAGVFENDTYEKDGRHISIYHRETEPRKVAQLPEIADQVFAALQWMEDYTAVPYPFAKYDLIILPGFQFGGMEHTGATLYNDKRMFLPELPTVNEELGRAQLIAHETAHMWFGDYVTMAWFDDVWTKEVFANYFAARMVEPLFPEVDHELCALKDFYTASYSEDRTIGTNAIKQPLDNLNNAGLIYGQIIYNKAPVVMNMLVSRMGKQAFQQGIREYLTTYAYGNATWEGLVKILDKQTPKDLMAWSEVWVHEKGMPQVAAKQVDGGILLTQEDPFKRGVIWPQRVGVMIVRGDSVKRLYIDLDKESVTLPYDGKIDYIIPGFDGKGYGYFMLDSVSADYCLRNLSRFFDPVERMAVVMSLNENRINGRISPEVFIRGLDGHLTEENDVLIYSAMLGYLSNACSAYGADSAVIYETESKLLDMSRNAIRADYRQLAFRTLLGMFRSEGCTAVVYDIWNKKSPVPGLQLSEGDDMKMAYELAVRLPEKSEEILRTQANRITNPDRLREFNFIAGAVNADDIARDTLFGSFLKAENRKVEPWTGTALYYLNHPLRQKTALKYIRPALEAVQDVQRTGDIFFPKNWASSCLRGHNTPQAADSVRLFLKEHPDYPVLLKNKILQSADHLFRLPSE